MMCAKYLLLFVNNEAAWGKRENERITHIYLLRLQLEVLRQRDDEELQAVVRPAQVLLWVDLGQVHLLVCWTKISQTKALPLDSFDCAIDLVDTLFWTGLLSRLICDSSPPTDSFENPKSTFDWLTFIVLLF